MTSTKSRWLYAAVIVALFMASPANGDVILGSFNFNSAQFGNTLLQSDGGTHASRNWLNVVNANPGSPAFLTGPNFDTGIANIGLSGTVSYTIGYATPITNHAGNDLGVIVARYSSDNVTIAFSTDGGTTFTADTTIPPGAAVTTGVPKLYFYPDIPTVQCHLFVASIDLTTFGIPANALVNAIRVSGNPELDLIRVAGFAGFAVPEPSTLVLAAFGFIGLGVLSLRRRKR